MAHTDKDRPYWVRVRDTGIIEHDHRTGECIIGDNRRERWGAFRHHYTRCKKRVRVEFSCHPAKVNGHRELVFERDDVTWRKDRSRESCWTWTCDCPYTTSSHGYFRVYDDGSYFHGSNCDYRYFNECLGHWGYVYDDSIPCSCDDREPRPTCFPTESAAERYAMFGGGGVPHWFVAETYHRPERRRARDTLRDMVKEWNGAYNNPFHDVHDPLLEDGDYFSPQARNAARWYYW